MSQEMRDTWRKQAKQQSSEIVTRDRKRKRKHGCECANMDRGTRLSAWVRQRRRAHA